MVGMMKVGTLIVRMGWHPARLLMHVPLLSSLAPYNLEGGMYHPWVPQHEWVNVSWYWLTQAVPDKGPLNGCCCLLCDGLREG